jgi:hypothetical protein
MQIRIGLQIAASDERVNVIVWESLGKESLILIFSFCYAGRTMACVRQFFKVQSSSFKRQKLLIETIHWMPKSK